MHPYHIDARKEDIASICILPGDPLRAKYIAKNFLTDAKLVNDIRNMYAYTGYYKGVKVTVMGHGMGIPSIGIYAYELYHFYDVEKIIRIGTCGSNNKDVKVLDVILSTGSASVSTFAKQWGGYEDSYILSDEELNQTILDTANKSNIPVKFGPTFTSDVFDIYCDISDILNNIPLKNDILAIEMEGFALMHIARLENKKAAMLLTVVDSKYESDKEITSKMRETSLNQMITLALDSIIK